MTANVFEVPVKYNYLDFDMEYDVFYTEIVILCFFLKFGKKYVGFSLSISILYKECITMLTNQSSYLRKFSMSILNVEVMAFQ